MPPAQAAFLEVMGGLLDFLDWMLCGMVGVGTLVDSFIISSCPKKRLAFSF